MIQKKQMSAASTAIISGNITVLRNRKLHASEKRSITEAENSSRS
ncbi:hypothetical protein [Phocaeicola coprocola]|nr:hypothetical protein [Phocaeicola coprocola]